MVSSSDPADRNSRRPASSGLTTSAADLAAAMEPERSPEADTPLSDVPPADRYPENHMPIAGIDGMAGADPDEDDPETAQLRRSYERFCELREAVLIDYTYNTARAYWGDLDDLFLWCVHRNFEIFDLTDSQFRQYVGLLRRRKYSENTIRRRGTAWRHFQRASREERAEP